VPPSPLTITFAVEMVRLVGQRDHIGAGGGAGDRRRVANPLVGEGQTGGDARADVARELVADRRVPLIDTDGLIGAAVVKVALAPLVVPSLLVRRSGSRTQCSP